MVYWVSEFPSLRASEFPSLWVSEIPSFRASEFPSFQVSELPIWSCDLRANESPSTLTRSFAPLEAGWRTQTHRHTDRHTDMATYWPTRPSGAELVKMSWLVWKVRNCLPYKCFCNNSDIHYSSFTPSIWSQERYKPERYTRSVFISERRTRKTLKRHIVTNHEKHNCKECREKLNTYIELLNHGIEHHCNEKFDKTEDKTIQN